jgi:hypothetical protein
VRPYYPAADPSLMPEVVRRFVESALPGGSRPRSTSCMTRWHDPCPGRVQPLPWPDPRCMVSMRLSSACLEQANARTDIAQACARTLVQVSDDDALSCNFKSRSTCQSPRGTGRSKVTGDCLARRRLHRRITDARLSRPVGRVSRALALG